MLKWLRWHCPSDTGFEIRALAVWGRARYLSVTEAPHNTDFLTWMGTKHFCFFETAETGNRTPNSGVKCSGANHYPRAPASLLSWAQPSKHEVLTQWCWASVADCGPALDQHWGNVVFAVSVDKCFAPKRNNKFRLIHSLYQELYIKFLPFNNINYKGHWHYIY